MRHFIETAPRDGKFAILEEDASGKYDVACWSPEVGEWVGESGEPIKITPSYWHPIKGEDYLQQGLDPASSLRPAAPQPPTASADITRSVAPAPVTVSAVGTQTTPAETKRTSQARWILAAFSIAASLVAAAFISMYFRAEIASHEKWYASLRDILGVSTIGGQEREKTVALMQDVDAARQALTASTAQHRQALEEERDRSAALASELATARREFETKVALSSKAGDEVVQLRKAAEAKATELQRSLQQERDKANALARELEFAQRVIEARAAPDRTANSQNDQTRPVTKPAAAEQPGISELQGPPEAARLTTRARALLAQGNIGAARIVLERAAEMGSAEASFALAETYDPRILSSWGTYGTRGDASKARELYAKAMVGGIKEAKDRFNALRQ